MLLRRVEGNSMVPGLTPGVVVIAFGRKATQGHVVIARQAGREVIKRIHSIDGDSYELRGDNAPESTDSREYGPVGKGDILGVVMMTFPVATRPPEVRTPYAYLAGWVATGILIISALVHLFRIDTFLPLLDNVLPGSFAFAALVGSVTVTAEVFAVPFMLRMKLSPLMHLVSGFMAVLAPLTWLLVTIWAFGLADSTAQFGEFMATRSSLPLLMLDAAWLGFNLWALWLLGYDRVAETLRNRR